LINRQEGEGQKESNTNTKIEIPMTMMTIKYTISKSQYEVLQKVAEIEDQTPEKYSHDSILSSLESDVDNNFGRRPENYHKGLIEKLQWPPKPRGDV